MVQITGLLLLLSIYILVALLSHEALVPSLCSWVLQVAVERFFGEKTPITLPVSCFNQPVGSVVRSIRWKETTLWLSLTETRLAKL